jgi:molecular chaperone DnaK (HSP70)
MLLGIDFGTTHTVVALVDRGNYPVVSFEAGETFPSLVAAHEGGELRYGPAAAEVRQKPGWTVLRSLKRLLNEATCESTVTLAGRRHRLIDLLTGFFVHLREQLLCASNAGLFPDEPLHVAISVPANASSAQRLLTLDAFRRAGFEVEALLNEPSAAGFEYAHRYRKTITARREYVVIYDLGGGTFDASLLRMTGRSNSVVHSEGVQRLGGDDFDERLLEVVLDQTKTDLAALSEATRALLLEECRQKKEAINPNTRKVVVDLSSLELPPLAIPVDEVYAACAPLVERTLAALEPVLLDPEREPATPEGEAEADGEERDRGVGAAELAGIYVVGGAGSFPLIPRLLRERYGDKRVKRSPHPFAATAMGLAIFLDHEAGYTLSEKLSRTFGVFREGRAGSEVVFDPIFPKGTPLPGPGEPPLFAVRRYRAMHNIGHFRFLECGRVEAGRPDGDVTPWDDFCFPFDRGLRQADLRGQVVVRWNREGPEVEEIYRCDDTGAVDVTVKDLSDGFARSYHLGRAGAGAELPSLVLSAKQD